MLLHRNGAEAFTPVRIRKPVVSQENPANP